MSRAQKALSVLVVACLGLWGCTQGAANGRASIERLRALETKITKLEDDFRAVVAVREQLRKQVEKLQAVVKERDELRQQLATRTSERDSVQSQFDQFRKGLKTLLGQAEVPATLNTPPVISASEG